MASSLLDMVGQKIINEPNNPSGFSMEQAKLTHELIKHLNMIYSKILANEMTNTSLPTKEIAGQQYVTTRSWFNPGHSSVTESA